MEIDVNLCKPTTANGLELKTISAGSYSNSNGHSNLHTQLNNNNNSINNTTARTATEASPPYGCCGILSRLLCSSHTRGKTATSSGDYNTYNNCAATMSLTTQTNCNNATTNATGLTITHPATQHNPSYMNLCKKKNQTHRRTPQEIYFESRGKSCKKLLKFNGNCNKIMQKCSRE